MRMCVFGSGSKGNCIYIGYGSTHLIIDSGLALRRIEKCLSVIGVAPREVTILVTHEHFDHVHSLPAFVRKYNVTAHAHEKSREGLSKSCDVECANYRFFSDGASFSVGEIEVCPFKVGHDVPCVGYTLSANGKTVAVTTDVGKITPSVLGALTGSDLVVIESNHDCEMLRRNVRYSDQLKRRILSENGHLSNEDCARALSLLAATGTKQAILAHLSEENNCPELAFETVKRILAENGFREGVDIQIEVAEQHKISSLFEIS